MSETSSDFNSRLRRNVEVVNNILDRLLSEQSGVEPRLKKAIAYTLKSPGKRIRSTLALWSCELVAGKINANAEIAAAAVEMVHTYSLVHDDLPSMDDDDLRRGQPTCHKAFDEATAILAGDGLLTLAFEILAERVDSPEIAVQLICELAKAAGGSGMIAGQMADLRAENVESTEEQLRIIHTNKTAKMFGCAAVMGAIAGGADQSQIECLGTYGLKVGLGFQITDDILDVCACSEQLGKTAGKDVKAGKSTYPSIIGMEKSRQLTKILADEALEAIASFGSKADLLRKLVTTLLERTR
jgi:geranylgeranyl diphosphate synthase type II